MYEEQENYRVGINWKDIIIKVIAFAILIFIIIILIPRPNLDPLYSQIFNQNISAMKEGATGYYTNDRLPENIGDYTKMTLEEMEAQNLVIPFVDKNGDTCNKANSFVQVTKTGENEHILKVQLSCGDETDFILETLACKDLCANEKCEKPEEEKKPEEDKVGILEYQYKQPYKTTENKYYCPVGYYQEGQKCYKVIDDDKIAATPNYSEDKLETINANKNTVGGETITINAEKNTSTSTTCPEGYVQNGSECYIYTNGSFQPGDTTYTCPAGYENYGNTCYKRTSGTTNYTCPSGYSDNGSNCVKTQSASAHTNKTCPSGYSPDGGQCSKTITETKPGSKYCPSGYSPDGSRCSKTVNTGSKWQYSTSIVTNSVQQQYQGNKRYDLKGSEYKKTCNTCFTYKWYYTYYVYTKVNTTGKEYTDYRYTSATTTSKKIYASYNNGGTSYSCPNGGSLNGSTCYSYTSKISNGMTCPSGYTNVGNECHAYTNKIPATGSDKFTCPAGYVAENNTCVKKSAANVETATTYTCPAGYNKVGTGENTKCQKTENGTTTYSCPTGYKLNGDKCTKEIKGSLTGYTCPEGYNLRDNKHCVKTKKLEENLISEQKEITKYRYTWSSNKYLDGWTATGVTRNK